MREKREKQKDRKTERGRNYSCSDCYLKRVPIQPVFIQKCLKMCLDIHEKW